MNGPSTEPLAISITEAGRRLGIQRTLVYRLARQGAIPTAVVGRRRVVPLAALEQWLAERTEGGEPAGTV